MRPGRRGGDPARIAAGVDEAVASPGYGLNFLTISMARGPISPARER